MSFRNCELNSLKIRSEKASVKIARTIISEPCIAFDLPVPSIVFHDVSKRSGTYLYCNYKRRECEIVINWGTRSYNLIHLLYHCDLSFTPYKFDRIIRNKYTSRFDLTVNEIDDINTTMQKIKIYDCLEYAGRKIRSFDMLMNRFDYMFHDMFSHSFY